MARHATASVIIDFVFDSEEWGVDFESMSDEEFHEFVSEQYWEVVNSTYFEVNVEEHDIDY